MDRGRVLDVLQRFFEAPPPALAAAWLFGSVARGDETEGSDVDVAVLTDGSRGPGLDGLWLDLQGDIEAAVGEPTQLVVDRAPVDLVHRVLRDGILLCEPGRSARIRFEVRARNEYGDLLPYLQEYRRAGR